MATGLLCVTFACVLTVVLSAPIAAEIAPPQSLVIEDHAFDGGTVLDVTFGLSPDDKSSGEDNPVTAYSIRRSGEFGGLYTEVQKVTPSDMQRQQGSVTVSVEDCVRGEPYWFRVLAVGADEDESAPVETGADSPAIARRQFIDGGRVWLGIITVVICGSVVLFILLARTGRQLYIRKIAGLEAVEEAVGRATEMGRSCLFVPGILDMNDIQTIAGLTILSRVAQRAAEYDADVEVPTSKSLVMTAARETVESAYLTAGRPDAYNEDSIFYVTDEQFGYVAYLTGAMVRDEPAACFYMGAFFAESLILAETGNAIGSIQVAGTAQPAQLPFFVAACDYTLIGEEFFAASAYLSHDPDQLGSLKGQDVGKLIVGGLMILGVGLLTLATLAEHTTLPPLQASAEYLQAMADYIRDNVLSSG